MTVMADVPAELTDYLDELVQRLSEVVELDAVYLFGSAAQEAYEHGRSAVDVIAVTRASQTEKEAIAAVAEAVPCPARKLELVVYSIAQQHSIALLGPPWEEMFAPVTRAAVEEALDEAAAFEGWDDPLGADIAAARARIWRETGKWVSKAEARRSA